MHCRQRRMGDERSVTGVKASFFRLNSAALSSARHLRIKLARKVRVRKTLMHSQNYMNYPEENRLSDRRIAVLGLWQKLVQLAPQPMRYIVTAGLVGLLLVAWVLTGPLFRLGDKFSGGAKIRS